MDPFHAHRFKIEIQGIVRGGFREVSGLDSSQDPIEYRDGTDPTHVRKLPGLNKYSNISLKWGSTDDASLWEWRKKAIDGNVERKNGSIILINDAGEEKTRWNFHDAWPTKWTGPSFNATGNEVAIETLEIAHEGVEKA
jgi:phage tail-like protein